MGNAWSKHVGEWYEANKGKDGINRLSDAMRSAKCKADFRANNGSPANGPSMKTEKKKNEKKAKKGTRKMRGGSTLGSPANFSADSADSANPVASEPKMNTPTTPVMKGGKSKRYSLKELMKFIEKNVGMVKGGSKGKMIKGGRISGKDVLKMEWTGSIFSKWGSSEFKPQELLDHLNNEKSDVSKYQVHHLMSHIVGFTGKKDQTALDKKYAPFSTFDDTDSVFCKYDEQSQNIILALKAYDDEMTSKKVEDSSNTGKVANGKDNDYLEITTTLISFLESLIPSAGSTIAGGNKQNVIVAFTKNGSDYTNVIHKKQGDSQFDKALTELTKTA